MNAEYNIKGKFELTPECVQQIIDIVKQKNNDITFILRKSESKHSKSLYIDIKLNYVFTTLRISDHYTKKFAGKHNLIVDNNTGMSNVCYKLQSTINTLHFKNKMNLLNKIGNGKL